MKIKYYSVEYPATGTEAFWEEEVLTEYDSITDERKMLTPTIPTAPEVTGAVFSRFYPNPESSRFSVVSAPTLYIVDESSASSDDASDAEENHAVELSLSSREVVDGKFVEEWQGMYAGETVVLKFEENGNDAYGRFIISIGSQESEPVDINDSEVSEDVTIGDYTASIKVSFLTGTEESSSQDIEIYSAYAVQECKVNVFYYNPTGEKVSASGYPKTVAYGTVISNEDIIVPPRDNWEPEVPDDIVVDGDKEVEIPYVRTITVPLSDDTTYNVKVTWNQRYPDIPYGEIPKKDDEHLSGVYLSDVKIYSARGEGVQIANQEELNNPKVELSAKWVPATGIHYNSISELRELIGIIPTTFASSSEAVSRIGYEQGERFSFKEGFSHAFHEPVETGGSVVTRGIVNAIGNIGSQCQFYEQCGGYYSFDRAVSDAIEGYPKNARLKFYDEETNSLRTVRSLHDDNNFDFTKDKSFITTWTEFRSSGATEDHLIENGPHWIYVDDTPEVGIDIDYSDSIDLSNILFVSSGKAIDYEVPYDGYLSMFALACLNCSSLKRESGENVSIIMSGTNRFFEPNVYNLNGMYVTAAAGSCFLDVYGENSSAKSSILLGMWLQMTTLDWFATSDGQYIKHFSTSSPLSPFSIGIMVSKGDVISVSNSLISVPSKFVLSTPQVHGYVHSKTFSDKEFARNYIAKHAKLFRRRATV